MIVKRMICNKNSVIFIILVSLFLCSCGNSIDTMIVDYNAVFCPDYGATEDGYVPRTYKLSTLLEKASYWVKPGSSIDFKVSDAYYDYRWTLTGNDKSYPVNTGKSGMTIFAYDLGLDIGYYTLTITVKNDMGDLYFDKAQLVVSYTDTEK